MYSARILADSIGPHGFRLTTFEAIFPRMMLAELNTHRMLSRNSASSRAIPPEQNIENVRKNPFIPEQFYERAKGMQRGKPLSPRANRRMQAKWLEAAHAAADQAALFLDIDKGYSNRLIEPFMWHTAIISATDWTNFFNLRDHEAAQVEIRKIASMMRCEMALSSPQELAYGDLHLPLVETEEKDGPYGPRALQCVSAGRCARVSYDKHHEDDHPLASMERWDRLAGSGHWSPGEHPAECVPLAEYIGNFCGFLQLRKTYDGEAVFAG